MVMPIVRHKGIELFKFGNIQHDMSDASQFRSRLYVRARTPLSTCSLSFANAGAGQTYIEMGY